VPALPETSGPRVMQAAAYSPAFAPGGDAMYFHEQRGSVSALKRADTVAGVVRNVTSIVDDSARNFHPRPSPDGRQIAFDSDRDGVRGVYVAEADGRGARRISGSGFASVPSWSPDGRRVAFARAEPSASNVWNLWIVDVDGSNLRRLTKHRAGQAWGGSWFPDGRRIAYSVEDTLVILDLDAGDARVLSSPRPGRLVRTPAVSPDGSRIVFQVYRDGTWIADARTGEMQRVLADPSAEEFTWAPDGRHVAFHSRRTGSWSVWVMPI
jgi:Tol biopolymer transport system component